MPKKIQTPKEETPMEPPKLKKQKAVAPKPASGLSAWRNHLKTYKDTHPDVSLKQAMQEAKKTYKKA